MVARKSLSELHDCDGIVTADELNCLIETSFNSNCICFAYTYMGSLLCKQTYEHTFMLTFTELHCELATNERIAHFSGKIEMNVAHEGRGKCLIMLCWSEVNAVASARNTFAERDNVVMRRSAAVVNYTWKNHYVVEKWIYFFALNY